MGQTPLLSIIVPVYNVEKYLDQCIQSIILQEYKNIEILLINDGSTDESKSICEYYKSIDSRIIFIDKPKNEGLVRARKTGISIASGEYIGFVDSDDYVQKEMFSSMIDKAIQHDADIVVSGHKELLNTSVIDTMQNKISDGFYSKNDIIKYIYPYMMYTGTFSDIGIFSYLWNKIFKKNIIYQNLLSINDNIAIGEDAACAYSCMIDANKIYILNNTLYMYRQRIGSMVKASEFNTREINNYTLLYNHLKNKFKNHILYSSLLNQLQYFILSLITVRISIKDSIFGFTKIPANSKISIVGAGTFGQNLYRKILGISNYTIIKWYDEYADEYKKLGLAVEHTSEITNDSGCDFVIVAYINPNNANNISNQLINSYNISPNKILTLDHYKKHDAKKLLEQLNLPI